MTEPERTLDLILGPYLSAIERLDVAAAEEILNNATTFLGPKAFALDFALVALREIGERWHSGSARMAQERVVCSQVTSALLGSHVSPSARLGRTLLAATTPRQRHEVGLLVGALLAKLRGMKVVYLGVGVPEPEIAWAARKVGADVVLLASLVDDAPPRLDVFADEPYMVWMGGPSARGATPENVTTLATFEALDRELAALEPNPVSRSA